MNKDMFYPNIKKLSELGNIFRVPYHPKTDLECKKIRDFTRDKLLISIDYHVGPANELPLMIHKIHDSSQYWLEPTNQEFIKDIETNKFWFMCGVGSLTVMFTDKDCVSGFVNGARCIGYRKCFAFNAKDIYTDLVQSKSYDEEED